MIKDSFHLKEKNELVEIGNINAIKRNHDNQKSHSFSLSNHIDSSSSKKRKLHSNDKDEQEYQEFEKLKFSFEEEIYKNFIVNINTNRLITEKENNNKESDSHDSSELWRKMFEDFISSSIDLKNSDFPKSLNNQGSYLCTLSSFWVTFIQYKIEIQSCQEDKKNIFLRIFDNASSYPIENKLDLIEFVLRFVETNFTQQEILNKINDNSKLKEKISNIDELNKNHYKYLISNPEFFDKLISFRNSGSDLNYSSFISYNDNDNEKFYSASSNKKMKTLEKKEVTSNKKSVSSISYSAKGYKTSILKSFGSNKKENEHVSQEKNSFSSNKKFMADIEYPLEGIVNNLNESLNKVTIEKEEKNLYCEKGENKNFNPNSLNNDTAILNQIDEILNFNVDSIPEEKNEDEENPVSLKIQSNLQVNNIQRNYNSNSKIKTIKINKEYIGRERIEKPKLDLNEMRREIVNSYNLEVNNIQFNIIPSKILKNRDQDNLYHRSESFCIHNQDKEKKRLSFNNNFSKNDTQIREHENGHGQKRSKEKKREDNKSSEEEDTDQYETIVHREYKINNMKRAKSAFEKKNKANANAKVKAKSKSRNNKKK